MDFYLGMFKKNDLLVAQDTLYKDRVPFRYSFGKYGRKFHCPITYIRVEDRLNVGRGPRVQVIRGGLRRKILVLRLISPYNLPISANIYVGCQNQGIKKFTNPPWTVIRPTKKSKNTTTVAPGNGTQTNENSTDVTAPKGGGNNTSVAKDPAAGNGTSPSNGPPATDTVTVPATDKPAEEAQPDE